MQTSSQKFTYTPSDPNGNLIKKVDKATGKTTTYQYDAENQLISVISEQGSVISYKYDGLGRRIEKDVDGKITRYVYDNEDILLEYNYDPSAMS
jgi:YD repeat-containing protein